MLNNKNGIIFGVANKRSIAWATAQSLHEAGAQLAFTYQGDRLKENVESLTNEAMPGSLLLSCDVSDQEEVEEIEQVGDVSRADRDYGDRLGPRSPRASRGGRRPRSPAGGRRGPSGEPRG